MSFTGTQALADFRTHLDDPAGTPVWTDAELVVFLNAGLIKLRSEYPESHMDAEGARTAHVPVTEAGLGNTLVPPDEYREILVQLMAKAAAQQDGNDKADRERAAMHGSNAADRLMPHAEG